MNTSIVSDISVANSGVIVEVLVVSVAVISQPTVVLILVEVEQAVVVVSKPLILVGITEHKIDSGKNVCVEAAVRDSAELVASTTGATRGSFIVVIVVIVIVGIIVCIWGP